MELATERLADLEAAHPHTVGRISLVEGDVTVPGLGIDYVDRGRIGDIREVWHLAAVYDLAVPEGVARRVNVEGTAHVLEFCLGSRDFHRLQYVSTCYVSGDHHGEFGEDDLDLGQGFLNHYESTKFEAEVLVRRAMKAGLPATIYRPGIVVGDSRTGETQKYDGPYMYATYMSRLPRVALIPGVGDFDVVRAGLVPRDYVIDAMDVLSVMDKSQGRTYALTDPNPPTTGEVVQILAEYLHRKPVRVPLPLGLTRAVVAHVPGAGEGARAARRGAGLPRRADHLLDEERRGRPRGHRGRVPAVRRVRRAAAGLHDHPPRARRIGDDVTDAHPSQ